MKQQARRTTNTSHNISHVMPQRTLVMKQQARRTTNTSHNTSHVMTQRETTGETHSDADNKVDSLGLGSGNQVCVCVCVCVWC
jgi:hypothetical protein